MNPDLMKREPLEASCDTFALPAQPQAVHDAERTPRVPAALPWKLLLQPARRFSRGRPLPLARWAGLEAARRIVERLLSAGLEQTLSLEFVAKEFDTPTEARFGLELTGPGPHGALLGLDLPAARAIVDVIESRLGHLQGADELTETEYGLLEYTALACLDEFAREAGPDLDLPRIGCFLTRSGLAERLEREPALHLGLRLRLGARQGRGFLRLPEVESAPDGWGLPATGDGALSEDLEETLELRFALPPLTVTEGELARAEPGDLLLLGTRELAGRAGALISSTGWRICTALLETDRPASLSVRPERPAPETHVLAEGEDGSHSIQPLIGSVRLTLSELRSLGPDTPLDLEKDLTAPVQLCHEHRTLAWGELVRANGEIAVRLLKIDRTRLGER